MLVNISGSLKIVMLAMICLECMPLSYIPSAGWGAHQIKLQSSIGPFTSANGNMTFNYTLDRSYANIAQTALALCGFQITNRYFLNYQSSVTKNAANTSGFTIHFQIMESTASFGMISFYILVTTTAVANFIELFSYDFYPLLISQDPKPTIPNSLQFFIVGSSMFVDPGDSSIKTIVYIYSFNNYNYCSDKQQVTLTLNQTYINSNALQLCLYANSCNIVKRVSISVIRIKAGTQTSSNSYYQILSLSVDFNTVLGVNASAGINPYFGQIFNKNCSIALTSYYIPSQVTGTRQLYFNSLNPYITQFTKVKLPLDAFFNFIYTIFCYVNCSSGQFFNSTTSLIKFCQPCSDPLCLVCQNDICTVCPYGYAVIFGKCLSCSSYVSHCLQCTQITKCGVCSSEFQVNNLTGKCTCIVGFEVSGFCVNDTTCIAYQKINSVVVCVFCDISLNYFLSNGKCICKTGYSLHSDSKCYEICGDGLVFAQQCDDGNLINGDGCSSDCTAQNLYKCTTTNHTSNCVYYGILKISIITIMRNPQENQGIFTFALMPPISNFNKIDYGKDISINFGSIATSTFTYDSGILTMTVNFVQNLQNFPTILNITLNPNITYQSSLVINFTSKGSNLPLTIVSKLDTVTLTNKLISYFMIFAIIVFIFSLTCHKMIGVQTIYSFQIIYLFKTLPSTQNSLVSLSLDAFRYSLGNLQANTPNSAFETYGFLYRLNYYKEFTKNYEIALFLQAAAMIFFVFSLLYRHYLQNESKVRQIGSDSIQKSEKVMIFSYRNILFPLTIFGYFQIVIAMVINNLNTNQSHEVLYQFGTVFPFAILSFVLFFEYTKLIPIRYQQFSKFTGLNSAKKSYILCFLLHHQLILICFLISNQYSTWILLAIDFFYLIFLLVYRPYKIFFHNFAIIFNQIITFLSIALIFISTISTIFIESTITIIIFVIMCLLVLVNIFAILRVWIELKKNCRKIKKKENSKRKVKKDSSGEEIDERKRQIKINEAQRDQDQNNKLAQLNPYRLETQQMGQLLSNDRYFNEERQRNELKQIKSKIPLLIEQALVKETHKQRSKQTKTNRNSQQLFQNSYQAEMSNTLKQIKEKLRQDLIKHKSKSKSKLLSLD